MTIQFKDSLEYRIKTLKIEQNKPKVFDYILIIYFLSFLLANIFYFKTLDIYIILIVFFIAILSIIIYKKKRNLKCIKERFSKMYGNETDMTITFEEDKILYIYNQTNSKYTMFFDEVKKIQIIKDFLYIFDKYKSYIYIPLQEISREQKEQIINYLKEKKTKLIIK